MVMRGWVWAAGTALTVTSACSNSDSGGGDGDSRASATVAPGDRVDTDGDGIDDATALDTDGDGLVDSVDTNGDGQPDGPYIPPSSGDGDSGAASGGTTATCEMVSCGTECVDTAVSDAHCGVCGNACGEYEACQSGACVTVACEGVLSLCGQDCLDTSDDPNNCGTCGETCDLSFVCESSSCTCTDGRTDCGAGCTHTYFDRQNCGACADTGGTVCSGNEACVSGTCQTIDIPAADYCTDTNNWDSGWTALEFEILDIVNRYRAEGFDCDEEGYFPPTGPLQMESSLRCAARMHSKDMVDRDYFSHTNPDGEGPGPRLDDAGYSGSGWGENIAAGNSTAEGVMEGWMESDGHCSNIMNPNYTLIGVGYHSAEGNYGHYWTQTFGRD